MVEFSESEDRTWRYWSNEYGSWVSARQLEHALTALGVHPLEWGLLMTACGRRFGVLQRYSMMQARHYLEVNGWRST